MPIEGTDGVVSKDLVVDVDMTVHGGLLMAVAMPVERANWIPAARIAKMEGGDRCIFSSLVIATQLGSAVLAFFASSSWASERSR